MVTDNLNLLTAIQQAINQDEPLTLDVEEGANISTEQYKLRRVLAATDTHRQVEAGKFAGLGSLCTIRVLYEEQKLLIRRRKTKKENNKAALLITPSLKDENTILKTLSSYPGDMTVIEFKPTSLFNLPEFEEELKRAGWTLFPKTKTELEDGLLTFAMERRQEEEDKRGFDFLDSFKGG